MIGGIEIPTDSPECIADIDDVGYPASSAQQRIWFLDQLETVGAAYNEPCAVWLSGPIDAGLLEQCVNEIVNRHEILRTTYTSLDGELVQIVGPRSRISLKLKDLTCNPDSERDARAREEISREIRAPFDLTTGPILRAALFRLAESEHIFLFTTHHIATDGWSMRVFFEELSLLYPALKAGESPLLPDLPIQYIDYAFWQRQPERLNSLCNTIDYWKRQLKGAPPVLEVPTDRHRPAVQSYNGSRHYFALPPLLIDNLRVLSRSEHVTFYMLLLAAFKALLARYTGKDEIVIGSPIAGRDEADTTRLIGLFLNTLVLRTDLAGDPTFRELLMRVRDVALGAYAHQELTFEKLVEEMTPERDLSRSPLFQVMFVFQNAPHDALQLPQISAKPFAVDSGTAKLDLTLSVMESAGGIDVSFEYNTELFDASTVKRMAGHFEMLLGSIVVDPGCRLSQLSMLTPLERHQLLEEWNDLRSCPTGICIHELVEAQVERTPDSISVECSGQKMTFAQLNNRANQLARALRQAGVGSEVCVGVYMDRSLDMIVSLLGILKSGGTYVPLDPAYPLERVAFMLQDCQAAVLLTQESYAASLSHHAAQVICLDADIAHIRSFATANLSSAAGANNLAYVIYTSGSTGLPKGVAIEHKSAATLIQWSQSVFTPEELSGVLASTSICFDLSVFEIFVPLSTGGRVVLVENALELLNLSPEANVSLINTVPSAIAEILRHSAIPSSVATINLAGEPLSTDLVNAIYQQTEVQRVYDLYGPTEDTTYSTFTLRYEGESATIGRPIAYTQAYVLDNNMQPVPVGIPGELFLGGGGLARGYLGRPELTEERFVPNPFGNVPGARLYRTSDLVRYRCDGNLEYMGRLDHQVKIRGFRVELGEIEETLRQHQRIRDVVVVAREDISGNKKLVAYLIAQGERAGTGDLRDHIRRTLPEYMLPSEFVYLQEFPLTPNGKVDRRALPDPAVSLSPANSTYSGPQDQLEHELVTIWEEVLKHRPIGVLDNFFELGGHSLLAIHLLQNVAKSLKVQLPLSTLFRAQDVSAMAALIRGYQPRSSGSALVLLQKNGNLPPLFCAPVGGGSAYFYRSLALTIGPSQPLYTFEPRGIDGLETPFETVEEMASYYIDNMRTVQSTGPYYLGGLSFGGLVAFEMARQLDAAGDKVALLVMMDSFAPGYPKKVIRTLLHKSGLADLLYKFVHHRENLTVSRGMSAKLKYLSGRAGEMIRKMFSYTMENGWVLEARRRQIELPEMLQQVSFAEKLAIERYKPGPYSGEIKLFQAREVSPHFLPAKSNGWDGLALGGIDLIVTPGTHYSMLDEPCVQITLSHLRRLLKEAREMAGSGVSDAT